jgi:CRISPR-associated endonuclease Csn1
MYIDEFNAIWKTQLELSGQKPHPTLSLQQRREIYHTIFYQRPLKSQKEKIGSCELERGKRRAPEACLEFQRFRYWQRINDLRILLPDKEERELTREEKEELAGLLETGEKNKYIDIANHFGWKKAKYEKHIFNLQNMGDSGLPINVTAKRIREVYPDWDKMTESRKNELVDILLLNIPMERIVKRLIQIFGLDKETAMKLADVTLVSDYASYSRKALKKLLPEIQKGTTLPQAYAKFYPDYGKQVEKYEFLPPVEKILRNLTNPSVKRSLTELRKIVNAVIQKYGKPETIRVELSRILKRSKKVRAKDHEKMLKNKSENERIEKNSKNSVFKNRPVAIL